MYRIAMNENLYINYSFFGFMQARFSGFNKHTQKVG